MFDFHGILFVREYYTSTLQQVLPGDNRCQKPPVRVSKQPGQEGPARYIIKEISRVHIKPQKRTETEVPRTTVPLLRARFVVKRSNRQCRGRAPGWFVGKPTMTMKHVRKRGNRIVLDSEDLDFTAKLAGGRSSKHQTNATRHRWGMMGPIIRMLATCVTCHLPFCMFNCCEAPRPSD